MLGRRSIPGGRGWAQYAQQLIRHHPARRPERRVRRLVPARARAPAAPRDSSPTCARRNLTEKASRFPARIFQPASYRLGIPRVEWLVDFDLFLATNFLAPATDHAGSRRARRPRPGVPSGSRSRRRTSTRGGAGVSRRRSPARRRSSCRRRRRRVISGSRSVSIGDRVHVVHHGVDAEAFAPVPEAAVDAVRRRLGIPGPYVLFVGGIEPRKNLEHPRAGVRSMRRAGVTPS